jgi:hypothetical protein
MESPLYSGESVSASESPMIIEGFTLARLSGSAGLATSAAETKYRHYGERETPLETDKR